MKFAVVEMHQSEFSIAMMCRLLGVSASGYVNRSDFDLDRFIPAVADRVEIMIEAEFTAGSSDSSRAAAAIASGAVAGSD